MKKAMAAAFVVLAVLAGDWWMRTHLETAPLAPSAPSATAASSDPGIRTTEIERKTAELVGTTRTTSLIADKAQAARKAVREGRYADADRIAAEVLAASALSDGWRFYPFNVFLRRVAAPGPPGLERQFDAWVESNPQSALPHLFRATCYVDSAWRARGNHLRDKTGKEHWQTFEDFLQRALDGVKTAIKLDPGIPNAYYMQLEIMASGGNTAEIAEAFERAIARYPDYYPLYRIRLRSLAPQWGGSLPAMFAFVDKYADQTPPDSPRRMLYLELYAALLDAVALDCRQLGGNARELCMRNGLAQSTPAGLDAHVNSTLRMYSHTDQHAFTLELESILRAMVGTEGAAQTAGAVLQLAADAMGSEIQMVEEHPGRNNYMLDAVTAQVWLRVNHYANAETKFQAALRDLAHAPIANEEERTTERGAILSELAELYHDKGQLADAIAYQRAADTLGVDNRARSWLICSAYHRIKDDRTALAECTRAYDDSGDMLALFFRGKSNLATGHREEAIRDLTEVAESEHWKRDSAAIALSVIYGDNREFDQQVRSLNSHSYLFDESQQNRETLAVAYNNRCYGYMQLGQLEKALSDCTASLKYGSLPDALHKQQELLKALKLQTKGA